MKRIIRSVITGHAGKGAAAIAALVLAAAAIFAACGGGDLPAGPAEPAETGVISTSPDYPLVTLPPDAVSGGQESTPGQSGGVFVETFSSIEELSVALSKKAKEIEAANHGLTVESVGSTRIIVKGEPDFTGFSPESVMKDPYGYYIVQFLSSDEAEKFVNFQAWNPNVEYAEPDTPITGESSEDPSVLTVESTFTSWGTSYVEAAAMVSYVKSKGKNQPITVAIVDSGCDLSHSFLASSLVPGFDLVDGDDHPYDINSHGTHVAGTLHDCTLGLNVRIMPVRVINGQGKGFAYIAANGIRYAADNGAKAINLSIGMTTNGEKCRVIDDAVNYALSKGCTLCVAAGNETSDTETVSPANILKDGVIVVAAINYNESVANFSNYGASVDIAAPGVKIMSSVLNNSYGLKNGTSMATPHVTAAAAMVMMVHPDFTPADVEIFLKEHAVKDILTPGRDDKSGYGALKLSGAAKDPPVTVTALELISVPSRTSYFTGDRIDTSGLKLKVSYSNKTTATVTSGFSCSPSSFEAEGAHKVTVTYGGKSVNFSVSVTKTVLTNLDISKTATKTKYFAGERTDTSGLQLRATYNSGKSETVSSGFTVSPQTLTSVGTQTVTVSYGGRSVTYIVDVSESAPVTTAAVTTPPPTPPDTGKSIVYLPVGGYFIYGDSAYVTASYNSSQAVVAERYKHAAESYMEAFPGARVSVLIVPTSAATITDEPAASQLSDQGEILSKIGALYSGSAVNFVNIYDTVMAHRDEYLYLRTDHHWNSLGAYYAYADFVSSVGMTPTPVSEFTKTYVRANYIGSIYNYNSEYAVAAKLRNFPDTIEAYVSKKACVMTHKNDAGAVTGRWDYAIFQTVSHNGGIASFIGGDKPFVHINVPENPQDLSILVIKDSYADQLVPFFIEHYGNIYVVDPRYNSTNKLKSQFADAGLDDILFVNNLQVANSNYWQKAYHRLIGISY